ncbi:MAG: Wzz/FepE/Etk N-terminal domain-containing protein [Candidatus Delongbacteria bacterium]|jgi:uncharacterized protein involved in exopolysaccharide biosynthesis|nr:Wzz/FepE/Etk N-terminal domain-containing protein [Candidatus Delongbacteria bacterium]
MTEEIIISEDNETTESEKGIDIFYLIGVLWKYKKPIAIITFMAAVLSVVYVLTATRYYMSSVSLYPITKDQGGPLKELAASLGLGAKPEGYYLPDVISSRRIMKQIIDKKYKTMSFPDSVNLLQFWEFDKLPVSENMKYEYALKALRASTSLREDKETTLITLTIITKEKKLSADIVQNYIDVITYYLQNELKSQIKQSIIFTEIRLKEVEEHLLESESDLLEFQEKNAKLISPFLSLQVKRKAKEIQLTTDLEVMLRKQIELLKIEEERSKPVMNILDKPDIYDKHVRPQGRKVAMTTTISAFFISFLIFLVYENEKKVGIIQKLKKSIGH